MLKSSAGKQTALQAAQASLVQVQQTPILQFLARMESWQADLDLLFDRMVVIGEVWSSVSYLTSSVRHDPVLTMTSI